MKTYNFQVKNPIINQDQCWEFKILNFPNSKGFLQIQLRLENNNPIFFVHDQNKVKSQIKILKSKIDNDFNNFDNITNNLLDLSFNDLDSTDLFSDKPLCSFDKFEHPLYVSTLKSEYSKLGLFVRIPSMIVTFFQEND